MCTWVLTPPPLPSHRITPLYIIINRVVSNNYEYYYVYIIMTFINYFSSKLYRYKKPVIIIFILAEHARFTVLYSIIFIFGKFSCSFFYRRRNKKNICYVFFFFSTSDLGTCNLIVIRKKKKALQSPSLIIYLLEYSNTQLVSEFKFNR